MLITKIKLANLVTYMGIVFSVMAMCIAYNVNVYNSLDIKWAYICFMLAGVCDLFDGTFARKCKRTEEEKEIGIQMDSLADVLSFLVVPVMIYMAQGMNKWYHIAVYVFYVMMGITRLGFFNVFAEKHKGENITTYRGLAVTYAALIMPTVYVILYKMPRDVFEVIYMILICVMSVLYMTDIKIKKPNKIGYICYALLAFLMIIIFICIL